MGPASQQEQDPPLRRHALLVAAAQCKNKQPAQSEGGESCRLGNRVERHMVDHESIAVHVDNINAGDGAAGGSVDPQISLTQTVRGPAGQRDQISVRNSIDLRNACLMHL